jgi:hypothetical protein
VSKSFPLLLILSASVFGVSINYKFGNALDLKNDIHQPGLIEITETIVKMERDDDQLKEESRVISMTRLDAAGRILSKIIRDSSGLIDGRDEYTWSTMNQLIHEKHTDDDFETTERWYKYEPNGRILAINIRESDGDNELHVIEYDNRGNMIKEIVYAVDGNNPDRKAKTEERIFSYDERFLLSECRTVNRKNIVSGKVVFKHNSEARLTDAIFFDPNNRIRRSATLHYDDCGYLRRVAEFNESGDIKTLTEYRYNKYGNCSHVTITHDPEDTDGDVESHTLVYKYETGKLPPQMSICQFVPPSLQSGLISDSSLYRVWFNYTVKPQSARVDSGVKSQPDSVSYLLPAGRHVVRSVSYSGLLNRKVFYIYCNDTVSVNVRSVQLLLSPSFALMYLYSDLSTNVIVDAGFQTTYHDFYGSIGAGGTTSSSGVVYFTFGIGYRATIPLNKLLFLSLGGNLFAVIPNETWTSGWNDTHTNISPLGISFHAGPHLGMHIGNKVFHGFITGMPIFGQSNGVRVNAGLSLPLKR